MKATAFLPFLVVVTAAASLSAADVDVSKLPAASTKTGLSFDKDIKPIFDKSCIKCHGAEKQKGKLRLDTLEATLKGGKNPTFVIGKPNSSMLLARVFLERNAGDVMPPKDENPLTEKQKEALYAFVEGQPIPDELAKAAIADTKKALAAPKPAPKPKK